MNLEEVLTQARADAETLRRLGHANDARILDNLVNAVTAAAEDYLTWLSEGQAELKSGHSIQWLRSRYPSWERRGHARKVDRKRQYRDVVVPQREHTEMIK